MSKEKKTATIVELPPAENCPPEPDWGFLKEPTERAAAHNYWLQAISAIRAAGALDLANGHQIFRLVESRLRYDKFSRKLWEQGEVTKGTQRKAPHVVPYWRLARQAEETCRMLEAELCIAPLRRARAGKVERKPVRERPADRWRALKHEQET